MACYYSRGCAAKLCFHSTRRFDAKFSRAECAWLLIPRHHNSVSLTPLPPASPLPSTTRHFGVPTGALRTCYLHQHAGTASGGVTSRCPAELLGAGNPLLQPLPPSSSWPGTDNLDLPRYHTSGFLPPRLLAFSSSFSSNPRHSEVARVCANRGIQTCSILETQRLA